MYGDDVGELSVFLQFNNTIPSTPLWSKIGGDKRGSWNKERIDIRYASNHNSQLNLVPVILRQTKFLLYVVLILV